MLWRCWRRLLSAVLGGGSFSAGGCAAVAPGNTGLGGFSSGGAVFGREQIWRWQRRRVFGAGRAMGPTTGGSTQAFEIYCITYMW